MKTTAGQKVKIGGFIVVGLVVLLLGIFLIGNQKSMFSSTFNVHGMFKNVNGLQVGNNVRFAGINIGVVDGIDIVNDTTVKVTLTINDDVKKFIKKDARMSIGSDGLMGDKLVVIGPGTSNVGVKNGDELAAVNPLDMDKVINKLTKIADNAAVITEGLGGIVNKVNNGQGSLGRLLNSDKMARSLESTVSQAKTTMANVHNTSATLNEDLKAAQHNFLLKGFFNKKKKAEKARQDSIKKAQENQQKQQDKGNKPQ
ncbi:MlaD family protein [Mucilaginibacter boryungensis]|uniref:MCE family protein n=1 Tax=Mucilaginibacter boryungensis TaxID=768480 RepID=A0ABR9XMX5_9SPHI|nr:MlaD family protein [Mucilaginibacter boryungensis]MBE9668565.1 MCE family protein [Mucilaginibacter boryungensis]